MFREYTLSFIILKPFLENQLSRYPFGELPFQATSIREPPLQIEIPKFIEVEDLLQKFNDLTKFWNSYKHSTEFISLLEQLKQPFFFLLFVYLHQ